MNFHHIGIATHNIEETSKKYKLFGYQVSTDTIYDPLQNVYITFMEKLNSPRIELVAPVDLNSPILNTLNKNGTIPYHFCYEVDNIVKVVESLKKMKFLMVSKIVPAIAFNNRLVCFLYSKESGLIELLNIS
jgi:methylmalonyl-CoA/ethylmalonyl-CoA epimerase